MTTTTIRDLTEIPASGLRIYESADVATTPLCDEDGVVVAGAYEHATLAPCRSTELGVTYIRALYRWDGSIRFFRADAEALAFLREEYGDYVARER